MDTLASFQMLPFVPCSPSLFTRRLAQCSHLPRCRLLGVGQHFKGVSFGRAESIGPGVDLSGRRPASPLPQDQATPIQEAHLEAEPPDFDVKFIRTSIQFAIAKLDEYYELLQQAQVYWFTMILHPGHKKRWIERNLEEEDASRIITAFKQFFQEYGHLEVTEPVHDTEKQPPKAREDELSYRPRILR
ncbi:hypothetical protein B0T21DRAFT_407882 [Apiosordaria backusii]|uniref:Uncharacterized protein n=1 Tax=Apiosordaria backusii TaxID=314023 RepID=A0AA40K405_9PEZI|nr:hypothetical protein B0T21DRAFT_407882 [Apiosordaria backusii]